jgi:hypothetical protein
MTSLLILTIRTGTAGKHSDVAQGLANTIRDRRSPLMGEKGLGLDVCGTCNFYEEGGGA